MNNSLETGEGTKNPETSLSALEKTLLNLMKEDEQDTGRPSPRLKLILRAVRKAAAHGQTMLPLEYVVKEFEEEGKPGRAAANAMSWLKTRIRERGVHPTKLKSDIYYRLN